MKTCCNCKKEKEYSEFYTHKRHKDGYDYYCKECKKLLFPKNIKCPKCGTRYDKNKQFCQGKGCSFNISYWIKTGKEYTPSKASCLPFTKGF